MSPQPDVQKARRAAGRLASNYNYALGEKLDDRDDIFRALDAAEAEIASLRIALATEKAYRGEDLTDQFEALDRAEAAEKQAEALRQQVELCETTLAQRIAATLPK